MFSTDPIVAFAFLIVVGALIGFVLSRGYHLIFQKKKLKAAYQKGFQSGIAYMREQDAEAAQLQSDAHYKAAFDEGYQTADVEWEQRLQADVLSDEDETE